MPTNLADLPSNKPIPNARCQMKVGQSNNAFHVNSANNGAKMGDGVGGFMEIQYQATYPCLWVVRTNFIFCGVNGGWQRNDHGVYITPADADGQTHGCTTLADVYDSTTVGWIPWSGCAVFRLNAGVLYTAYVVHIYSAGGTQQFYLGPEYARIIGRVVGEGAI